MWLYRQISPDNVVYFLGMYALACAHHPDVDDPVALIAELEGLAAKHPEDSVAVPEAYTSIALASELLRDPALARRAYAKLLPWAGTLANFPVDRCLGVCAMVFEDWAAARRHFDRAEPFIRRNGLIPQLGYLLVDRAELVLGERGRAGEPAAIALLGEALRTFEGIGWTEEVQRVRRRIADLSVRAPALPAGLSAREAEVLRLAAGGLSNRDIADALVISEKTVANHLTSIFNKIGVENRTAATAFAIRHGIA